MSRMCEVIGAARRAPAAPHARPSRPALRDGSALPGPAPHSTFLRDHGGMRTSFLHGALRRALLVSLAVPALADLGACGGKVVLDGAGGSLGVGGRGTAGGGSPGGAGGNNIEQCALASTTPVSIVNGGCAELYDLVGPSSACSPGAGGSLTPTQCVTLCPPNMAGEQAQDCNTSPGGARLHLRPLRHRAPARRARVREDRCAGPARWARSARFLGDAAHLEGPSR